MAGIRHQVPGAPARASQPCACRASGARAHRPAGPGCRQRPHPAGRARRPGHPEVAPTGSGRPGRPPCWRSPGRGPRMRSETRGPWNRGGALSSNARSYALPARAASVPSAPRRTPGYTSNPMLSRMNANARAGSPSNESARAWMLHAAVVIPFTWSLAAAATAVRSTGASARVGVSTTTVVAALASSASEGMAGNATTGWATGDGTRVGARVRDGSDAAGLPSWARAAPPTRTGAVASTKVTPSQM